MDAVKKAPQYDLDNGNTIKDGSVSQGGNQEGDRSSDFPTASDVGGTPGSDHVNGVWNGTVTNRQDRDKFPSPSGKDWNKSGY